MFRYFAELFFVIAGLSVIAANIAFLSDIPLLFPMLNLAGGLTAVVPSLLLFYSRFRKRKEMEEQFLIFLADITEAINSGMTLPLALQHVSKRDYGELTPLVNSLASQVDWGIPFQKALLIFSKKTGSVPIKRAVETIIQTYKAGGKIADTLESIGKSLLTLEKIKKERVSSVHSQIITSYIIYFVFILILVILQIFLLPSLLPQTSGISGATTSLQEIFSASFINFIVVQGFFAGLVTGKMAEGSVLAGLKHSVLLITIGYTIFSFAAQVEVRFI
jgi:flagellar protein FlaJ